MAMIDSRPNIVVDENFIMLEKRLRRRYAERASAYSNAEAIEQERSGARAFAIAPEAYGDSKFIGGISSFKNGTEGGVKYMTTDDYVAYFGRCHDTFGAMNLDTVSPVKGKTADEPRIVVNQKKIEQIRKFNQREAAKMRRRGARPAVRPTVSAQTQQHTANKTSTTQRATKPANENIRIESNKLDAFFTKLSMIKGRALASVAAFAICCTFAIGGIVALGTGDENANVSTMNVMRTSEISEQCEDDVHTNLLSTLE